MLLTEQAIKKAKVASKPRRLADGKGLYLLLNSNGSRWWRLDYQHAGKRKTLSMGTYPYTGLNEAREKRDEAHKLLAAGIDPGEQRKAAKMERMRNSSRVKELASFAVQAPTWARSLEGVGINDMEERAYHLLLTHRMATGEDVAHMLSLPSRKAQRLLDSIEAKGLVFHSPEKPRRYIAAPPKLAVEALISQRQAVLERVRLTIPELVKEVAKAADSQEHEQLVELITSRPALNQIVTQLRQTVQNEIMVFQRAPMLVPRESQHEKPQGVRVRTISDAGFLALPGVLGRVRTDMEAGEEVRVVPTLPIKMLVVDRRIGIVPLNVEDPECMALMVRSSSLLDALCALFELSWERATPVMFTRAGHWKTQPSAPRFTNATEQLIPLLAAGLNDKAIALEAGISAVTLSRRVAELMKSFSTRTRFQLGWRAAIETLPELLNGSDASAKDVTLRRTK